MSWSVVELTGSQVSFMKHWLRDMNADIVCYVIRSLKLSETVQYVITF